MSNLELTEVVRKLRLALRDTQQAFAQRLRLAISTVVRYESTRPPSGRALVQLEQLAREHGFANFATIFRQALLEELGETPPKLKPVIQVNPDEEEHVMALLRIIRTPAQYRNEYDVWKRISKAAQDFKNELKSLAVDVSLGQAVTKLQAEGKSPEEIAKLLGVQVAGDIVGAGSGHQ